MTLYPLLFSSRTRGDPLDLTDQPIDSSGNQAYNVSFFMEVRTAADDDSTTPVLRTKETDTETLPQSGADTLDGATGEIVVGAGLREWSSNFFYCL